ncbi:MAG: hypothetical protein ACXVCY_11665 [Pseudobdellovibrionaceae bacterium]
MKLSSPNNKGQFVIEAVLLMTVTMFLLTWGTKKLRDDKFLANLISGPWEKVSGMIEAGVWESPTKARPLHPNQIARSVTVDPNK